MEPKKLIKKVVKLITIIPERVVLILGLIVAFIMVLCVVRSRQELKYIIKETLRYAKGGKIEPL